MNKEERGKTRGGRLRRGTDALFIDPFASWKRGRGEEK